MTSSLGQWVDRVGLLLQFLSFWFVAPELVGEERIKTLGKSMATFFSNSIFLIVAVGLLTVAWSLAFREGYHLTHRIGLALLFSSFVLVPKFLLYRLVKERWLPSLVQHLSSDEHFRKGLLWVGGFLFTLGAALQFAATFF